ncbi:hypothetical protein RhiirC2_857424 [Rhizophagus irregularis]|uniref:Peptidase A2 domain-containing protein n=1 Tax=Rhizophagus irregularis TaxID=588596 RepID=A0A2N1MCB2_9GLOM|nr:hypothetical protein RhiirC2_857424 [Rhizophagus irregularis]
MLKNIIHKKDKKTDANIYNEIARLNLAQRPKIYLFSYFTINEKSKSSAETALSFCENDEEKLAYLNNILSLIESSVHSTVNGDEMSSTSTEAEEMKFNDAVFKKFVQKLNLKQLEQFEPLKDKDIKKFYDFAGPDFTWPSTSDINERRAIYDYITDPDPRFQEGQGEEIAINRLAYRRLIETGSLDSSKGKYVHIEHGKLVGYGSELSEEEYMELIKKNPGMVYSLIEQEAVRIRFSSTANKKEWQVNMRIRKKVDRNDIAIIKNVERDDMNNIDFRLILDSGAEITVIPFFIRTKMTYDYGWNTIPTRFNGYGSNLDIFKVSIPWEVSLGDGSNWTEWIETRELYCWQYKIPNNAVDCGLVGFDILNALYQIKIPGRPYIFVTQHDGMNQLQQIYNNH